MPDEGPERTDLRLRAHCRSHRRVGTRAVESSRRRAYGWTVNVTLLYFDDCPNWLEADGHLRTLTSEHPEMIIERRLVETVEDAEATRFRGSPSIIVNGVDPFAEEDAPVGLSCRIYQTSNGPAGSPTLDQLRDAIFGE